MSDTPRTEAQVVKCGICYDSGFTRADFTRTLERELAARDAEVARLRAAAQLALEVMMNASTWETMRHAEKQLRAALAQPKEPT